MLILKPPFDQAWKDKDPFAEIAKITGDIYRSVDTRQTVRFSFEGKNYFVKRHAGTTVKEVFKNF